jgi:hypothetical protein
VAQFRKTYLDYTLRTVVRNDPKTAVMFVDTLIRHGSGEGAQAIQKAINKTLSEAPGELREALGWQVPDPDGKMGPGTFAVFRDIANFGLEKELRKNLEGARNKFKPDEGDIARTRYCADPD